MNSQKRAKLEGELHALLGDVSPENLTLTSAPGSANRIFGGDSLERLVAEGNLAHAAAEAQIAEQEGFSSILGQPRLQIPPVSYDPANGPIAFGGPKF